MELPGLGQAVEVGGLGGEVREGEEREEGLVAGEQQVEFTRLAVGFGVDA